MRRPRAEVYRPVGGIAEDTQQKGTHVRVLAVYGEAYLSYRTATIVRTIGDERSRCTVLGIPTGELETLGLFEPDPDVPSRPGDAYPDIVRAARETRPLGYSDNTAPTVQFRSPIRVVRSLIAAGAAIWAGAY